MPSVPIVSSERIREIARRHTACSQSALQELCRSFVTITLGLRLSYLLDIQIGMNACRDLLEELRSSFDVFNHVFFLQDDSGDQIFLINARLLSRGLKSAEHVWVALREGRQQELSGPPPEISQLFSDLLPLASLVPLLESLPLLAPATLVALAGCLLEYPAIYVPFPDLWIDNIDLTLWRVVLIGPAEHILLQFTHPTHIDGCALLEPGSLEMRLKSMFEARMRQVASEWTAVRVERTVVSNAQIRL